jgi:uncharacterized protein YwqG
MDTIKKNRIPESLLPYKHLIDATNNQSYLLQFHPASELSTLNQIAGNPFIDQYSSIPKDDNGKDMLLLAQIDFNEIPLQQPFPQDGIVQFFVNKDFGKPHFQKQSEQFFVRYIEHSLLNHGPLSSFLPLNRIASAPIPYKFSGFLTEEPVSSFDYRYKTYFNETDRIISSDERTFHEIYTMSFLGAEHKIGGYPYFIQEDFRANNEQLQKYNTLLLQLVTDDEYEIGYRDSGIISFFIEEANLINNNFTDVYMHTEHY